MEGMFAVEVSAVRRGCRLGVGLAVVETALMV